MTTLLAQVGPSVVTRTVGSGLIGVREGLEAGIVVMVLIAFAVKSERRDALKWIWLGVGAALTMLIVTFFIIQYGSSTIDSGAAELIAGIASLVAVCIVTFMVLWMRKASAHMSGDLKSGLSDALTAGGVAVFSLSFLAVGREAFETALFMVGYAEDAAWPLFGLLMGILVAVGITWLLYRGAVRINFTKFFFYTGLFLIVVAAGILSYGVHALQAFGWLPGKDVIAFDISSWFAPDGWYGSLLGGIFNFVPNPTVLQVVVWTLYVLIVTALFVLRGRTPRPEPKPAAAVPDDAA